MYLVKKPRLFIVIRCQCLAVGYGILVSWVMPHTPPSSPVFLTLKVHENIAISFSLSQICFNYCIWGVLTISIRFDKTTLTFILPYFKNRIALILILLLTTLFTEGIVICLFFINLYFTKTSKYHAETANRSK